MIFKPNDECPHCKEHPGFMRGSDNLLVECLCILVQRAKHYLTSAYANSQFFKDLKPESFTKKIYFFEKEEERFKALVKSYLLNTAMTLTHRTFNAHHIVLSQVNSKFSEINYFEDLIRPDFLVINFFVSQPNKLSFSILAGLIQNRVSEGKITWVFSKEGFMNEGFKRSFTSELADYILFNPDSCSLPLNPSAVPQAIIKQKKEDSPPGGDLKVEEITPVTPPAPKKILPKKEEDAEEDKNEVPDPGVAAKNKFDKKASKINR